MTKLKQIKQYMDTNENAPTSVGHSEGSSKRKVYSNSGIFGEGITIPDE